MKCSKPSNVTDGSFQASIQRDYYLPIPQGNMSGYVAKMLQRSFHTAKSSLTPNLQHSSPFLVLYVTSLPNLQDAIFPLKYF